MLSFYLQIYIFTYLWSSFTYHFKYVFLSLWLSISHLYSFINWMWVLFQYYQVFLIKLPGELKKKIFAMLNLWTDPLPKLLVFLIVTQLSVGFSQTMLWIVSSWLSYLIIFVRNSIYSNFKNAYLLLKEINADCQSSVS